MADQTLAERLQPSLLDRLTDQAPGELKEAREDRVIDIRRLQEIIRRDLAWLLNTTNMEHLVDEQTGEPLMEAHPRAATSTLNYGVGDITGQGATRDRAVEIRDMIEIAIARFEPRILPGTLEVLFRTEGAVEGAIVSYDIRADMWAIPMPLELYMRTDVNLTTGELKVERR